MRLRLHIWRQQKAESSGGFEEHSIDGISEDMSFLEMLDMLNEKLVQKNKEPVAFDYDCREGICGSCSLVINGVPHGPQKATTACQLHMRAFQDNQEIYIEPWRAKAFPIVKDLVTNRSAFDRIIQKGGFISVNTGSMQDANAIPIAKSEADKAMDSAACIGCGACVAACKNSSAMLFVGAKVTQFLRLPQGQVESKARVRRMVDQMDKEGFGNCTNTLSCQAACPKEISVENIATLNREYLKSSLTSES